MKEDRSSVLYDDSLVLHKASQPVIPYSPM
jgi:hypothetical protein